MQTSLQPVIVQKLEMVLFTNRGDLFGEQNLGCNLEYFLWETKVPVADIKNIVEEQIDYYIPELKQIGYTLNIEIYEGSYRDILYLDFVIKGYNYEILLK